MGMRFIKLIFVCFSIAILLNVNLISNEAKINNNQTDVSLDNVDNSFNQNSFDLDGFSGLDAAISLVGLALIAFVIPRKYKK